MARTVVIQGEAFKERNIVAAWLLPYVTFGIYHLYWYYAINDEARRYLRDDSISPFTSLMVLIFGWILIVPPFISTYNTGKRIQRMQQQAGLQSQIEPVLCLALMFVFGLHTLYIQSHLNRVWETVPAG